MVLHFAKKGKTLEKTGTGILMRYGWKKARSFYLTAGT